MNSRTDVEPIDYLNIYQRAVKNLEIMKEYICFFDGCCEPTNPGGTMGMGVYISDGDKEYSDSKIIKPAEENTNNVAEYLALINLLKVLQKKDGCKIEIYGDSKMVINQMSGEWKIKKGNYKEHAYRAKKLYDTLCLNNEVNIYWIPRESNNIADELSKKHIQ